MTRAERIEEAARALVNRFGTERKGEGFAYNCQDEVRALRAALAAPAAPKEEAK